jgi:hypothetical protein
MTAQAVVEENVRLRDVTEAEKCGFIVAGERRDPADRILVMRMGADQPF